MGFSKIIDREEFKVQYELWHNRKITIEQGMKVLGINARPTWYRIARELDLLK